MGMIGELIKGGIQFAGQQDQGKKDEATAITNQRIANAQAQDALLRGTNDEARYRRQIAMIAGAQKAEFGARNVTATDTALDLLSDTAAQGDEDIQAIRNNAAREAWGYSNQASEASRWGANQRANANGEGIGTLLTSGAKAYSDWNAAQG